MVRVLCAVWALALLASCERKLEGAACPCSDGFACCIALDQCFSPTHECILRQNQELDAGATDDAGEPSQTSEGQLPRHCNESGFCGAPFPFSALSGSQASDVWAVSQDPTDGEKPSLVHFDGTRWGNVPNGFLTDYYHVRALHGATPRQTWFVGDDDGSALAFRYTEGTWGMVWNFGDLGTLLAVWSASDTDAWTVGVDGAMARWDGASWTNQARLVEADLRAVHGSRADDVWFAGTKGTVLHATDAGVRVEASPTEVALSAVFARALDDVWIAGDGGTLLHYDGAALVQVEHGVPLDENIHFTSLTGDANGLWIGLNDGRVIEQRAGGFRMAEPRLRSAVRGLWRSPDGVLWAVGDAGESFAWSSTEQRNSPAPIEDDLYDVWAAAADDLWVVGERGSLFHGDGARLTRIDSVTSDALHALDGTGQDDVWAVGARAILHFDGVRWRKVADSPVPLYDVLALAKDSAWAMGEEGLIMLWDGAHFEEYARFPALSFRTVWGAVEDDVWAFGAEAGCVRFRGDEWAEELTGGPGLNDVRVAQVATGSAQDDMWLLSTYENRGTLYFDYALFTGVTFNYYDAIEWYGGIRRAWPAGRRDLWLVGDALWHFSASQVDYAFRSLDWPLHGIWADGEEVWAVGEAGLVLHYELPLDPGYGGP